MFLEDLYRGKKGERYVRELMEHRNHQVKDVSNNPSLGYDFIISDKKVEIKTDYIISRTNNLFLEDYCQYCRGGKAEGWLRTCQADYLFYLDEKNLTLYIYFLEDIRKYIEENEKEIPYKGLYDGYKRVYGYCLNKDRVKHQTIKRGVINEKQN